jgi:hypothetical protein
VEQVKDAVGENHRFSIATAQRPFDQSFIPRQYHAHWLPPLRLDSSGFSAPHRHTGLTFHRYMVSQAWFAVLDKPILPQFVDASKQHLAA